MKINKLKVLEILSNTVIKNAFRGIPIDTKIFSPLLDAALSPYYPKFKEVNILDDEGMVDSDILIHYLEDFFRFTPILRVPLAQGNFVIEEKSIKSFIEKLKDFCNSQIEVKIENTKLTS